MPNMTLSIPEDLHKKMKEHTEIRWSEVARKSIKKKVEELEMLDKLTRNSKLTKKDVKDLADKIDESAAKKLGLE